MKAETEGIFDPNSADATAVLKTALHLLQLTAFLHLCHYVHALGGGHIFSSSAVGLLL